MCSIQSEAELFKHICDTVQANSFFCSGIIQPIPQRWTLQKFHDHVVTTHVATALADGNDVMIWNQQLECRTLTRKAGSCLWRSPHIVQQLDRHAEVSIQEINGFPHISECATPDLSD